MSEVTKTVLKSDINLKLADNTTRLITEGIMRDVLTDMVDSLGTTAQGEKADTALQSAPVDSVNTKTGSVELDTDDISEGIVNEYYTEVKVSANTDVSANTSAKHSHSNKADLDNVSGVNTGDEVGVTDTGTVLDLSNVVGNNYNYAAFSAATTYTTTSPVINGFARCFINAATKPSVTGATEIGNYFLANMNMEMVVESPDGSTVEFYFLRR